MLKVVDEVQYDLFRRILEGVMAAGLIDLNQAVDQATKILNVAGDRLIELGIVEEK